MNQPTFTVVTVCRNAARTIEQTMRSVLAQTYQPLEYIIIDGQSTDGTLEILDRYRDNLSRIVSEKDGGIFDAMNKGARLGTGELFLFLNADDYFFNATSLERAVRLVAERPSTADVWYGDALVFDEGSGASNVWRAAKASPFSFFRSAIPHPSTVYSKEALARNGLFDVRYPLSADYEWCVRALMKNGMRFQRMDTLVSVFSKGGISTNPESHRRILLEKDAIRSMHYSAAERLYFQTRWRLRRTLGVG